MRWDQSQNFEWMDEHAYIIYVNGLSITGILFMLYQDLHMFICVDTLKHTWVVYFKINNKYYIKIYEKI